MLFFSKDLPVNRNVMFGMTIYNIPLGPNQLGIIMSDIYKEFSLAQIYTNHSLRTTTVNLLDGASIPGCRIMSETSLKGYTGHTTTKTKKKMSNIVTDSLRTMNVNSETNTQMEANSEILTNNVNVTNEATFDINIENLNCLPLSSSQIDYLYAVVSDDLMDNDPAVDNFIRNMDLNVQLAQTTSASNALSTHASTVPLYTPQVLQQENTMSMQNTCMNSQNIPSAPVIYNYRTITFNYTK